MKKFLISIAIVGGIVVGSFLGGNLRVFAEEKTDKLPEIFIKAVNPGYTVDGVQNVGEMIEIGRNSSDGMISLAGLTLGYTNSSGNTTVLMEFSKYVYLAGETILLQLASSPGSELAHERYMKTLAFKAGPLTLMKDGEVIDAVCWTGKDGCEAAFDSKKPTTLVRNLETGKFEHLVDYQPDYDPESYYIEDMGLGDEVIERTSQCKGVEFSEILSYYESLQSEQFIELHNSSAENVMLDGCSLKYKNKLYPISGMIMPDGYLVRYINDFKLTKNPTTSNAVELVDADGVVLDKLVYPNGQRKGAAYAWIGYDENGAKLWRVTYVPTPGEPNNYQEFKTCEAGKVINEVTGNCVKATTVTEKICPEGQYLNILTGRCKKNSTDEKVTQCKEGYYLNEKTGRCKKIQENTGADYVLTPETYEESSSFVALYLVLGVLGVGTIYIIYEFRHEIMKILRRTFRR